MSELIVQGSGTHAVVFYWIKMERCWILFSCGAPGLVLYWI